MSMFDEVNCGIDNKEYQSKDICGVYVSRDGQVGHVKRQPDLDLVFIEPDGSMKIIPEALNSTDTGGMDRGIIKYLLEHKYPTTLTGLAVCDFTPRGDFCLYDGDNNKELVAVVRGGRVAYIQNRALASALRKD